MDPIERLAKAAALAADKSAKRVGTSDDGGRKGQGRHLAVMMLLIAHNNGAGASLETADALGMRAMHHAAKYGDTSAAKLLLRVGASAKARNKEGQTPADLAAGRGRSRLADILRVNNRVLQPTEILRLTYDKLNFPPDFLSVTPDERQKASKKKEVVATATI